MDVVKEPVERRVPCNSELRHVVEVFDTDPMCDRLNSFIDGSNQIEGMFILTILICVMNQTRTMNGTTSQLKLWHICATLCTCPYDNGK